MKTLRDLPAMPPPSVPANAATGVARAMAGPAPLRAECGAKLGAGRAVGGDRGGWRVAARADTEAVAGR